MSVLTLYFASASLKKCYIKLLNIVNVTSRPNWPMHVAVTFSPHSLHLDIQYDET